MIRWGILGLGNMGNHFSNSAKEVNNIKINGIASLSESKLKNFSEKFSIPKKNCLNSYDELINSDLVDAIYISTINNTHFELISKCAKSKKHILCEKPMSMNYNEALEAKKIIKDNGVNFFEGIAYYSHPLKNEIEKIIYEKEIGDLLSIESSFGFKSKFRPSSRLYDRKLGGGAILDIGCYPISFLMLFSEDFKNFIFKNKEINFAESNVDNYAEANIEISEKISSSIKVSIKDNYLNNCILKGTDGDVVVPEPWLPSKKTFIEVRNKKKYYKKFVSTQKSVYAHQIEKVSKAIFNNSIDDENLFNINKSIFCSNLLEKWKE